MLFWWHTTLKSDNFFGLLIDTGGKNGSVQVHLRLFTTGFRRNLCAGKTGGEGNGSAGKHGHHYRAARISASLQRLSQFGISGWAEWETIKTEN